jgi:hypothetical protein
VEERGRGGEGKLGRALASWAGGERSGGGLRGRRGELGPRGPKGEGERELGCFFSLFFSKTFSNLFQTLFKFKSFTQIFTIISQLFLRTFHKYFKTFKNHITTKTYAFKS